MLTTPRHIADMIIKEHGRCWRVECLCRDCPMKTFCDQKEGRSRQEILDQAKAYMEKTT